MHPHTKFGVPSYQDSGDMAHCMFSKMAAILTEEKVKTIYPPIFFESADIIIIQKLQYSLIKALHWLR
jgi:hypothetical protein